MWKGQGPVEILFDKRSGNRYIKSLGVQTCPKCSYYMQTIPVDFLSAAFVNSLGRWRCLKCGYIPSLDIYDKEGIELEKIWFGDSM